MTEDLMTAFGISADQFGPELVSPAVAYLASEECAFNGDTWSVGGGSISRFFVGLTDGFFKHPLNDGPLTVDDVAAHLDVIRSTDAYSIPETNQDEFQKLGAKLLP
jgi:hypothetical protein